MSKIVIEDEYDIGIAKRNIKGDACHILGMMIEALCETAKDMEITKAALLRVISISYDKNKERSEKNGN